MNHFLGCTTRPKSFKVVAAVVIMAGVIALPSHSASAEVRAVGPQCEVNPGTFISCSAQAAKDEVASIILPVPVVGVETDIASTPKLLELVLVNSAGPINGADPNEHWSRCKASAEGRNGMNDPLFRLTLEATFRWNGENVLESRETPRTQEWNGWVADGRYTTISGEYTPDSAVDRTTHEHYSHAFHQTHYLEVTITEYYNGTCKADWDMGMVY